MKMIHGFASTSQDDYQLNMLTLIKHAARSLGKQQIVEMKPPSGDVDKTTYREIFQRINRLANMLEGLGVEPGDRVGVLDWNTFRHYELYFAISGLGAVLLQMNPRLSPHDLGYIVNHSKPKLIFSDESLVPVAESIYPLIEDVKGYVIMTDKELGDLSMTLTPNYSYEELLSASNPKYDWQMIDEKSACFACYTSGTTGRPKGVYYSHRNIYLHSLQTAASYNITDSSSLLVLPAMFHASGWGVPQIATLAGAKLVLPGAYSLQDIRAIIQLMQNEKVTFAFGATSYFLAMVEEIRKMKEKPDFSSMTIVSGATEPPPAMMRSYFELTEATVVQAYGATETTPFVTVNKIKPWLEDTLTLEEKWALRAKHGYPVTGIDIKIVGEDGLELPHDGNSVGEILVRGPWIAREYFNSPGSEDKFTEDGYWKSEDVGFIDDEEYLKLVDRTKDLIKSGGEWISSVDMENEIMRHPAVLEATVVGLFHPKWDERPLALVVLREGDKDKTDEQDIRNFLKETFAKWQLPNKILFVDEIPKTSVGKFDKKRLRSTYENLFSEK